MSNQRSSISISKLARYASDPNSVFEKVDTAKTDYGSRAHAAIGKRPNIALFIIMAVLIVGAAKLMGLF